MYFEKGSKENVNIGKVKSIFLEMARKAYKNIILNETKNYDENSLVTEGDYIYIKNKVSIVSNIEGFLSITSFIGDGYSEKLTFYRGQPNEKYKPLSSLFRCKDQIENEDKRYKELIMKKYDVFKDKKNNFDKLTTMQHFGLPTRLLDLTTNPLVALYFACASEFEKDAALFLFEEEISRIRYPDSDAISIISSLPLLDKDKKTELIKAIEAKVKKLNSEEYKSFESDFSFDEIEYKKICLTKIIHEIKKEKPSFEKNINILHLISDIVVYSNFENERVKNQNGLFVACGLTDEDMAKMDINFEKIEDSYSKKDRELFKLNMPKKLDEMVSKKIIITKESKKEFLSILNVYGINDAFIFPDIGSVANYIRNKDYSKK